MHLATAASRSTQMQQRQHTVPSSDQYKKCTGATFDHFHARWNSESGRRSGGSRLKRRSAGVDQHQGVYMLTQRAAAAMTASKRAKHECILSATDALLTLLLLQCVLASRWSCDVRPAVSSSRRQLLCAPLLCSALLAAHRSITWTPGPAHCCLQAAPTPSSPVAQCSRVLR